MKKIIKTLILSLLIVFTLGTSSFALNDTESELIQNEIIKIDVSKEYKQGILDYLKDRKITKSEYNKLVDYIKQAKDIIGNEKNLEQLPNEKKSNLEQIVVNALAVIDLNAKFQKNNLNQTTLIAIAKDGTEVINVSSMDVKDLVLNFDLNINLHQISTGDYTVIIAVLCIIAFLIYIVMRCNSKY